MGTKRRVAIFLVGAVLASDVIVRSQVGGDPWIACGLGALFGAVWGPLVFVEG